MAIANAYGDKFIIPLDFEMLGSAIPYYQSGLGNRLCYEITFYDYNRVIVSSGAKRDSSYKTYPWNTRLLFSQISQEVPQ